MSSMPEVKSEMRGPRMYMEGWDEFYDWAVLNNPIWQKVDDLAHSRSLTAGELERILAYELTKENEGLRAKLFQHTQQHPGATLVIPKE